MMRCAITNGGYAGRGDELVGLARRWAEAEIDFVQLREKTMKAGELATAARGMVEVFRAAGGKTKLLVNGRGDIAVAAGADGVHLTARPGELTVEETRRVFAATGRPASVSVSCHSVEAVRRAAMSGANLILFGPVFEKHVGGMLVSGGHGLEMLRNACGAAGAVPVLGLGGITEENAKACVEAGAAGVAGIRLFKQHGEYHSFPVRPD